MHATRTLRFTEGPSLATLAWAIALGIAGTLALWAWRASHSPYAPDSDHGLDPHASVLLDVCVERIPELADARTRDELFFAMARAGDADAVTTLLDCGVNVDTRDRSGRTALHLASYHGHAALSSLLSSRGASPDARDSMGLTPLMNASFRGEDAIARALLDAGAPIDQSNAVGQTALMFAAAFDRRSTVALLESRGADPRRTDALGLSASHFAQAGRPLETVERFVRAGVREARALAP